jgi:hypothetical protein
MRETIRSANLLELIAWNRAFAKARSGSGSTRCLPPSWHGSQSPSARVRADHAEHPGVTRKYTSFDAVAEEVDNARIWAGAHCDDGAKLGIMWSTFF